MRHQRTLEEHIAWYVDAVKSNLVLRAGYSLDAADKAILMYRLKDKLLECPDIALHDDPRTIAKEIQEREDISLACEL